jgi:Uncharacterized conserved protein
VRRSHFARYENQIRRKRQRGQRCNARTKASGSSDTVYSYTSISGIPGNECVLNGYSIDLTKNGYRLPTEAEWEYACRAGTTTAFYWGSAAEGDYEWYHENCGSQKHPVAQKLPNMFGLYDMSGNVMEWCNDWHVNYSNEAQMDPTGPSIGSARIHRGGRWSGNDIFMHSAYREYGPPDNVCAPEVGFRVARPAR